MIVVMRVETGLGHIFIIMSGTTYNTSLESTSLGGVRT